MVMNKCKGVNLAFDDRTRLTYLIYNAHSLYRLKDRWIWFPDLPLASKWIHSVDQLLALLLPDWPKVIT